MEVSGQLHALAALSRGRGPGTIEEEVGVSQSGRFAFSRLTLRGLEPRYCLFAVLTTLCRIDDIRGGLKRSRIELATTLTVASLL